MSQPSPLEGQLHDLVQRLAGPGAPDFRVFDGDTGASFQGHWTGLQKTGVLAGYWLSVDGEYAEGAGWRVSGEILRAGEGEPVSATSLLGGLGTALSSEGVPGGEFMALLGSVAPPVTHLAIRASGPDATLEGEIGVYLGLGVCSLGLPDWLAIESLTLSAHTKVTHTDTLHFTELTVELAGRLRIDVGDDAMLLALDVALDRDTEGNHYRASFEWRAGYSGDEFGLGALATLIGLPGLLPGPLRDLHLVSLSGGYQSHDGSWSAALEVAETGFSAQVSLTGGAGDTVCEVDVAFEPSLSLVDAVAKVVDGIPAPGLDGVSVALPGFDAKIYRVNLRHASGGWAFSLWGEVDLAGEVFHLSVDHGGPGLGWELSLSVEPGPDATLENLLSALGVPTAGVPDVSLVRVDITHSTLVGATTITISGEWDGDPATLTAQRSHVGGSAVWSLLGSVQKGGATFAFSVESGATLFSYAGGGSGALKLSDLLALADVSGGPDIEISAALVAKAESSKLAAADIAVSIDSATLHSIPVLGERLPPEFSIGIDVHARWGASAANALAAVERAALPNALTLPAELHDGFADSTVSMRFGSKRFDLPGMKPALPSCGNQPGSTAPAAEAPAPAPVAVNQNVGGVIHIQSVRPGLHDGALELTIDGGVRFGPVTMDLMGFVVGYDLKKREPTVPSLAGLSLLLDRPPVRVQGGFLHTGEDFVGKAEITTSRFSLTALGGFALVQGSPSLFVYGVLRMPLGGPPFFFVEGIAAGFGLNRHLRLPTIDDVETFPLVQAAQGDAPINLEALHDFVSPKVGSAFFAVGVKFTSFKLVHGFLLAIVGMDTTTGDFEVAVVGTGEWISPPEAPPGARIAHVQLDILAKLSSRDASLLVQAKLGPDCFVISPQCHISGGMALATWYGGPHAGDFVISIGGYHPKFEVPAHYPVPGRLTLDYKISDGLHAGGSVYFALTPTHLMFGFAFNATWSTGPVRAWFDLSLDFLMKFKPLHYDATGHLEIGASVDLWLCTISVSAGADLHIWGPDLGGHACVHLGPFHGGLDFGAPVAPPAALTAEEFRTTFLPTQASDVITIRPAGGLRSTVKTKGPDGKEVIERWNFNPKEMAIEIDSLVPLDEEVGVPPMTAADAPDHVKVRLTHDVALARMEDGAWASVELPDARPHRKRYPPALWAGGEAAAAAGTLPAGTTLLGGAHPLERNGAPVYSRAELSADGGAKVYLAPEPSIPKDAAVVARSAPDRAADFEVYDAALRSADAAAKARQQARDRLLDGLARLLGDDALTPTRYGGRTSVEPLLDPPLHTGRGA